MPPPRQFRRCRTRATAYICVQFVSHSATLPNGQSQSTCIESGTRCLCEIA
ncbi:hypothetical protein P879_09007 [Paragonimus westermani]|uniref:Uncharacterized protein n=1 Tax=Paragonimus westermani TaxID=34504 RepID=A0A8T0DHC5_9TREM|nr:hypothetical protein P879_09007 [Paragonimus westermani]